MTGKTKTKVNKRTDTNAGVDSTRKERETHRGPSPAQEQTEFRTDFLRGDDAREEESAVCC